MLAPPTSNQPDIQSLPCFLSTPNRAGFATALAAGNCCVSADSVLGLAAHVVESQGGKHCGEARRARSDGRKTCYSSGCKAGTPQHETFDPKPDAPLRSRRVPIHSDQHSRFPDLRIAAYCHAGRQLAVVRSCVQAAICTTPAGIECRPGTSTRVSGRDDCSATLAVSVRSSDAGRANGFPRTPPSGSRT